MNGHERMISDAMLMVSSTGFHLCPRTATLKEEALVALSRLELGYSRCQSQHCHDLSTSLRHQSAMSRFEPQQVAKQPQRQAFVVEIIDPAADMMANFKNSMLAVLHEFSGEDVRPL